MSQHGITFGQIQNRIFKEFLEEITYHNEMPLYVLPSSDFKSQKLLYEVNITKLDVRTQTPLQRHTCPSAMNTGVTKG